MGILDAAPSIEIVNNLKGEAAIQDLTYATLNSGK